MPYSHTWITQFYLQITPCHSPDEAIPNWGSKHLIAATCLLTLKGERLSWPGWLTYSGWFTHITGHPSAKGRVQDREVRRPKTDILSLCILGCRWHL